MSKSIYLLAMIAVSSVFFIGCDKDDPEIPVEEELITTLNYYLTPTDGGDSILLSFKDLDGDGGNEPEIIGGTLQANQTYIGRLELLNESETPAEDITEEIAEEDEEHQFFFQTNISDLIFAYSDQDEMGNPVGLSNSITTGSSAAGSITVILRHEPNKTAEGVSDGDITNAGGESDIEVTFDIDVQ